MSSVIHKAIQKWMKLRLVSGYWDKPVTVVADSFTYNKVARCVRQSQKRKIPQAQSKMLEADIIRSNLKCSLKSRTAIKPWAVIS